MSGQNATGTAPSLKATWGPQGRVWLPGKIVSAECQLPLLLEEQRLPSFCLPDFMSCWWNSNHLQKPGDRRAWEPQLPDLVLCCREEHRRGREWALSDSVQCGLLLKIPADYHTGCACSFFKHSPPLELWPPLLFFYIGIKIISDLVQSNLKCDVPVFCIDNITCVCPNLRGRRRHFFLCVFQSPVYILDTCINNLYLYIYFWFLFVFCLVRSGFI